MTHAIARKIKVDMSSLFSVKCLEGEEIIFLRESFLGTGPEFYLNWFNTNKYLKFNNKI